MYIYTHRYIYLYIHHASVQPTNQKITKVLHFPNHHEPYTVYSVSKMFYFFIKEHQVSPLSLIRGFKVNVHLLSIEMLHTNTQQFPESACNRLKSDFADI